MCSTLPRFAGFLRLFFLLAAATETRAALYFTEGFEGAWASNAPPGWSYSNSSAYWTRDPGDGSTGCYAYPSIPGSAQQGSYCAYFNSYCFYSGAWATMTSPTINMSASTQGRISFYFYRGSGYSSSMDVMISSDNGATWSVAANFASATTGWQQFFVAVPAAYRTSSFKFAFRGNSDWWCDFWVDNVVVDDGAVPVYYCAATCYTPYYMGISNVQFGTINNSSCYGCNNNYSNYTALVTNVNQNQAYTLTVSTGGYPQYVSAWVDWNQNGSFADPGESYTVGYTGPGTISTSITIPAGATPGITRMRVRTEYSYYGYPPACGPVQYGEAEDYSVNVIPVNAPKIQLAPTAFTFGAEYGGPLPAAQNLTISNIGANVPMGWTASPTAAPAPAWLNAGPPSSGTLPGYGSNVTIPIVPNRTNLTAAMPFTTYSGTVAVSSPQADNSPQNVAVTYNITPAPHIDIGTSTITAKALFKVPTLPKKITVLNSGGAFGGGTMNWSVSTSTSWISFIGATTGVQGGSFQLKVDPGMSPVGTYSGSVTLTAYNSATGTPADNSPLTIPVNMEIESDSDFTATATINTAGNYSFKNYYGHMMLDLTLNSGSLGTFTFVMHPGMQPQGMSRLRYAWRIYEFSSSNRSFNVNMSLYYTQSEQYLGGATKPELFTVYRQIATGGAWTNMGGTSNPLMNRVTVNNITDFTGKWALASPWYPKHITLGDFRAFCTGLDAVTLEWRSAIPMNGAGFVLQRSPMNGSAWETIAELPMNAAGAYRAIDAGVGKGVYDYQVIGLDAEGNPVESQILTLSVGMTPTDFTLGQNYPNPFQAATQIEFGLPGGDRVTLAVYDLVGRRVATLINAQELSAGYHTVTFDAAGMEPGTYIYRLTSGGHQISKRLTITR